MILAEKGVQLGRAREEILALLAGEDPSWADPAPLPPDVEKREAEPLPIELSELDRRFLRSLKITAD